MKTTTILNTLMKISGARSIVKLALSSAIALGSVAAPDAQASTALNYNCGGGLVGTVDFKPCSLYGVSYLCPVLGNRDSNGLLNIGRLGSFDVVLDLLLAPEQSKKQPIRVCRLTAAKTGLGQYQIASVGGWGNCGLSVTSGNMVFFQNDASTAGNSSLQCRFTFRRG